jgi:hypothetical protein
MATASEKAQCMYRYAESGKSAITVQRSVSSDADGRLPLFKKCSHVFNGIDSEWGFPVD